MSTTWLDVTAILAGVALGLGALALGIYLLRQLLRVAAYSWKQVRSSRPLPARVGYGVLLGLVSSLLAALLLACIMHISR